MKEARCLISRLANVFFFGRAVAGRGSHALARRFTDNYKWVEVRERWLWTLFLRGDLYASGARDADTRLQGSPNAAACCSTVLSSSAIQIVYY